MKDMNVSNRNMVSIIHWKDPEKLKLFDKDIVCLTGNNKLLTFKVRQVERDWKWLCDKYNVKHWCFLSEVIPEECK